jgi:hypothetical protein
VLRFTTLSVLASLLLAAPASAQDTPSITFRWAPTAPPDGFEYGSHWYVDASANVPFDGAYIELLHNGVDQTDRTVSVTNAEGGTVTEWIRGTLDAGDVARFYSSPGNLVATATFKQRPEIHSACLGSPNVAVVGVEPILYAGAAAEYPFSALTHGQLGGSLFNGQYREVVLNRPLEATDYIYVAAGEITPEGTKVVTEATGTASGYAPCPTVNTPVAVPPARPLPAPTPTVPTDADVLRAVKASVAKSAAALRARTTPAKLTFVAPEAGKVAFRVTAGGKSLATGTGTSTAPAKTTVRLTRTAAGRKALARRGNLRLTLTATFTPARAGAKAQRASVTVARQR